MAGKKKVQQEVPAAAVVAEPEVKPAETAKVATEETVNKTQKALAAVAASVGDIISPELRQQLMDLATSTGVAAADAALVHVGDNIKNVDFGRYSATVALLAGLAIRELRNVLHGGAVSDEVFLEALKVVVPDDNAEAKSEDGVQHVDNGAEKSE
jgi:hypothetical protein